MRIISGSHRGRQIHPPQNFTARPTTDMAKEALFNILENRFDFEDIAALDLFAGTGSISYELASRGCQSITAIELDFKNASFIQKTAAELKFPVKCIRTSAFSYIKTCRATFDVIFADPPYDMSQADTIPALIIEKGLLKEGGMLIFEHSSKYSFSDLLFYIETRKYGKVHFSFFCNEK
ncbi:MAG: 16S rRNA (guanine(966)-N(2))-methyltransferase RsmD [Bacteroidetes bacterium HGW-Bacteroidetes-21]|jgi:16S rRNA (guanine(966)-N(2))-methyltransferase RsmD|nr:MAG: 16S rRNA (guanine(966)-N(2))-methyltransferase RsmD [Bacteroidetes bacterium HGW-Bacteroidetes-21]